MRRRKKDNLSFSEHLEELRRRLLCVGVLLFVLTAVSFPLAKPVLHFLIRPLGEAVFLSPVEPVLIHLKIALFLGAVLTPPDVLSQILLVIPILGLYGVSILTSRLGYFLRQRGRD